MTVAEMSSDAVAKLWDDNINRRLFELTHSQNTAEAFGGLLAISMPALTVSFFFSTESDYHDRASSLH